MDKKARSFKELLHIMLNAGMQPGLYVHERHIFRKLRIIIQGFEVLTPPVGRNVSETLRQIQAFQLVRESKGTEATPSGWKPGKQTLNAASLFSVVRSCR
jgi:acyl-CoA synthetase (AMP-forming)/AMP-acid ligase II